MVRSKYIITAVFGLSLIIALAILWLSFGVYLPIFSIVLIPALIMHVYAGIRAVKTHPAFTSWMLLSGLALIGFALFRPDADAHGPVSGFTALCFSLGFTEAEHAEPWAYSLEMALVLILCQIFINTFILVKSSKKK